jgi:hypothetical protein
MVINTGKNFSIPTDRKHALPRRARFPFQINKYLGLLFQKGKLHKNLTATSTLAVIISEK